MSLDILAERGIEVLGRYYSKYRGFVHDNKDPYRLSRLQLIIPEVTGHQVYRYWAYPTNVFAGVDKKGRPFGSQVIPPIGTMVWVEFERGHPEKPIWSHGYWGDTLEGKHEKPIDDEGEEDIWDEETFWFQTPGGIRIALNDKKQLVVIKLQTGETVRINQDSISLIHEKSISLGTKDKSAEPLILGNKHNDQEERILKAISNLTVMTALGPSSVPVNVQDFLNEINELPKILSEKSTTD